MCVHYYELSQHKHKFTLNIYFQHVRWPAQKADGPQRP